MTDAEVVDLEQQWCEGRTRFGVKAAHDVAERMRNEGDDVTSFRCVFCRGWHVGAPMSMESVQLLAEAIRHRAYPGVDGDAA